MHLIMFYRTHKYQFNDAFRTRDWFLSGNCWLLVLVLNFGWNHKMEVIIIFVCLDTFLGDFHAHALRQACTVDTQSKLKVHGTSIWRLGLRSSRPGVFGKKDAPKIFAKFTGKHLCRILFFSKVAGLIESLF